MFYWVLPVNLVLCMVLTDISGGVVRFYWFPIHPTGSTNELRI